MATTLSEIGDYVATQCSLTLGGIVDGALFIGELPDRPHVCDAILVYIGAPPARVMGGAVKVEYPVIRVLSRSTTADGAMTRAKAIATAIDGKVNVTMGSTTWHQIFSKYPPASVRPQKDANGRYLVVCDYDAAKAVSA